MPDLRGSEVECKQTGGHSFFQDDLCVVCSICCESVMIGEWLCALHAPCNSGGASSKNGERGRNWFRLHAEFSLVEDCDDVDDDE